MTTVNKACSESGLLKPTATDQGQFSKYAQGKKVFASDVPRGNRNRGFASSSIVLKKILQSALAD